MDTHQITCAIVAIVASYILAEWFGFIDHIADPRDRQLTRASHGAAITVFAQTGRR